MAQTPGYCAQAINGINPASGDVITNWYAEYCEAKPDKACMVSLPPPERGRDFERRY